MDYKHRITSIAIVLSIAFSGADSVRADSEQLAQVIRDYWSFRTTSNPLFATRAGDHRFNDQLADVSLSAARESQDKRRELLNRLDEVPAAEMTGSRCRQPCGVTPCVQ